MTDPKRILENRASSSYIAEYSAPKIELADLDKLQQVRHLNLNKKIETRLEEIKAEYDALVSLHEWNNFVDSFECVHLILIRPCLIGTPTAGARVVDAVASTAARVA